MYCGRKTSHTKKRGKIHRCDWCNEQIIIGEQYETWLYFDCGQRTSVYAHKECGKAWDDACTHWGEIIESSGDNERPNSTRSRVTWQQ